jgi:hypothetical protein
MLKARQYNLDFKEETITDCILLNLAEQNILGFDIQIYSKKVENVIGADFMMCFSNMLGINVSIRFQAKRLFPEKDKSKSKYDLGQGHDIQSDNLKKNALAHGVIPFYLLYNTQGFWLGGRQFNFCHTCNTPLIRTWGCGIAPLWALQGPQRPKSKDVCPIYPWHVIFKPRTRNPPFLPIPPMPLSPNELPYIVATSAYEMTRNAPDDEERFTPEKYIKPSLPDWVKLLSQIEEIEIDEDEDEDGGDGEIGEPSEPGEEGEFKEDNAARVKLNAYMDENKLSHVIHIADLFDR